jgi:hypothetical protein
LGTFSEYVGQRSWPASLPARYFAAPVHFTRLELGAAHEEGYRILNPTNVFTPDTPLILCVWHTEGLKLSVSLRGVWIAEDVGNVAPPNYKIAEADTRSLVANEGYFSLSRPNHGFPVGRYRLEIYLGDEMVKTVPFSVQPR